MAGTAVVAQALSGRSPERMLESNQIPCSLPQEMSVSEHDSGTVSASDFALLIKVCILCFCQSVTRLASRICPRNTVARTFFRTSIANITSNI